MKFTLALVLIATISQGLLVIAAPSKSNARSKVPKIPVKVNYDAYFQAVMRANNLTAADVAPSPFGYGAEKMEDQISTRAAGHAPTTIYCVGAAQNPLRTHIFPDVHGCNREGWTQIYTFISYNDQSAIANRPWVACPTKDYGHSMITESRCPSGTAVAYGLINNRDLQHESHIMKTTDGYSYMEPFKTPDFTDNGRKYRYYGSIRHVGIFLAPSQADVNFMASHASSHPHLYKRISEYNTFDGYVAQAAQTLIDNLGDLTTRRSQGVTDIHPGSGFNVDLRACNLQHYANRFQLTQTAARRDSDGTYRHDLNLYFQANNGQWQWMAGVTVPSDRLIHGGLIRSAFTEALRDHTTVRIDIAPSNSWMILPLPPRGPLPAIPIIYSGGFIR